MLETSNTFSDYDTSSFLDDSDDEENSSPEKYRRRLSDLNRQLRSIGNSNDPTLLKRKKRLEYTNRNLVRMASNFYDFEVSVYDEEFKKEVIEAEKEFMRKVDELRDSMIAEIEQGRALIDHEIETLDCDNLLGESKPLITRKLRRRTLESPAHPSSALSVVGPIITNGNSRRKPNLPLGQNNILASFSIPIPDDEIYNDLRAINKGFKNPTNRDRDYTSQRQQGHEVRVDNGRLYLDSAVFTKGQNVVLERRSTIGSRQTAVIHTFGATDLVLKNPSDNTRIKVTYDDLRRNKITIRKFPP